MQQTDMEKTADSMGAPVTAPKTSILLAFSGAMLLLFSSVMLFNSLNSYFHGIIALQYKMTDATVVKMDEHYDALGIRKEAQVRFLIKDEEKTALLTVPQSRIMKPGELTVVFYDQNNPGNAVLTQEIDYDSITVLGAFGLFGFCFGTLMTSRAFVRAKPERAESE